MSRLNYKVATYNLKWTFSNLNVENMRKRDHENEISSDLFVLRVGSSMSEWNLCMQYCDYIDGLRVYLLRKQSIGHRSYKVNLTVKFGFSSLATQIHGDSPIGRCCYININNVFKSGKVSSDGRLILDIEVMLTEDDSPKINKPTSTTSNKFFNSFGKYINSSQYSDFTLVCSDGVEFPVHRLVLARASKVFDKMFEIDMCEKQENKAILSDINSATLQLMLKYIYTDTKEINDVNTAINLLYACEKYELREMKIFCLGILMEKVEKENVLEVFISADVYSQLALEEKCISIILMHLNELMKSSEFSNLPMRLVLKVLSAAHLQKSNWTRETVLEK